MRRRHEHTALAFWVAVALGACGEFGIDLATPGPSDAAVDAAADAAVDAGAGGQSDAGADAAAFECSRVAVPVTCSATPSFTTRCQTLENGEATDASLAPGSDGGVLLTKGEALTAGAFWVAVRELSQRRFRLTAEIRVLPQVQKPADGFGVALVQRDPGYDGGPFPAHSTGKGADVGLVGMVGFHGAAAVLHTYDGPADAKVGKLEFGALLLPAGLFSASTDVEHLPRFPAGDGAHLRIVLERDAPQGEVLATLWQELAGSWTPVTAKSFGIDGAFGIVGVSAASGYLTSSQELESLEICRAADGVR